MRVHSAASITALLVSSTLFAGAVQTTALPPATMDELSRVAVVAVAGEHRERPHPLPARVAASENVITATAVVVPLAVAPPPITRGFQAVTDPLPGAHVGFDPADASGAAGPQHVVGAFNNAITVHDRAGNLLSQVSTAQFWHDPAAADKTLYDPRVAYDAQNDRWVIVMLGDDSGQVRGVLLVAISVSGNPAAGWRRFRFGVDPTGMLDGDTTHLAITGDGIAVAVNIWQVDVPIGTSVFTMQKAAAYAGPNMSVVGTQLPYGSDLVPVSSNDATMLVASWDGENAVTTFELAPSGAVVNQKYYTTNASFKTMVSCGQLGASSTPDCGYSTVHFGLTRDGTTWLVQQTSLNAAIVWKIRGAAVTAYIIQESAMAVSFPSLAVNRRGAALIGYVVMSPTIYPSAAYSYIDPAGNVSASAMVKNGEAPFKRERWGDFTTTVVDPVDDLSFWTLGVYANVPLGTYDRWATWWSYVQIAPAKTRGRAARH